jgi:predicted dehydrogenase
MVNMVLIGTGAIARKRHVAGILQSPSANLYGFYNRTVEKAEAFAAAYGGKVYQSLEEIWEDTAVDAVLVGTPTPSHCEIAVAALNAGKHVLCEKAMAMNAREAEQMVEAVRSSGKKLMMLHVQRRYTPHMEAKRLLENGEIGQLLSYRTFLGVMGIPSEPGQPVPAWKNTVAEIGSHRIDLMRYMTGSEVTNVMGHFSQLQNKNPDFPEDHVTAWFEHENGVLGVLEFGRTSVNGNDRSTVLFGTEGVITIFGEDHDLIVEKKNGICYKYDFPDSHPQNQLETTDLHQIFCECIEENRKMPIDEMDGLACMQIIDALIASNQRKAWISVGDSMTKKEKRIEF